MIKKLHPVAIVPQNLSTNEQIRAGFQEVLVDINAIIGQWNETLQPLIDSLPGGRRRLTPADRSANINPVENGCDGSQVFMDLTSTPQILSGFLYNSRAKRPKTIKEVVVDSHISLQSEISKLKVLVDAIDLADTTYDDTDLRNWIRRLAADTISDLEQGDPFGAGYFGDPTKTVQYSLHQRDVNLRTLIGIDEADYGLTNPGFSGTNYIDDMDILDALVELDDRISNSGAPSLQDAYDEGNTVTVNSIRPIIISAESDAAAPFVVVTSDDAVAQHILGNTVFYAGEYIDATQVGYIGPAGLDSQLVLRQGNSKALRLGNDAGSSYYLGTIHDFETTPLSASVPADQRGIRIKNSETDEYRMGFIAVTNAQDDGQGLGASAQVIYSEIVTISGSAPKGTFDSDGNSVADRVSNEVIAPSIHGIYKESTVKCLASFQVSTSKAREGLEDQDMITSLNVSLGADGWSLITSNTDHSHSYYIPTTGIGEIFYLAPLESATNGPMGTISGSVKGVDGRPYLVSFYDEQHTGFKFRVFEWDTGTSQWGSPTETITIDLRVI